MLSTASNIAACRIAKLRVEWIVAGCAPGVRTIVSNVRFHSITALTDWADGAALSCAEAPVLPPAWTDRQAPTSAIVIRLLTIRFSPFSLALFCGVQQYGPV